MRLKAPGPNPATMSPCQLTSGPLPAGFWPAAGLMHSVENSLKALGRFNTVPSGAAQSRCVVFAIRHQVGPFHSGRRNLFLHEFQ